MPLPFIARPTVYVNYSRLDEASIEALHDRVESLGLRLQGGAEKHFLQPNEEDYEYRTDYRLACRLQKYKFTIYEYLDCYHEVMSDEDLKRWFEPLRQTCTIDEMNRIEYELGVVY